MGGTERLLALDEQSGESLWTHEWYTSYRMLQRTNAIGPRATPTVDDDRVYVLGATGRLFCFDVATGEPRWDVDYVEDYGTYVPPWGLSSAPLVDGDRLIAIVGGNRMPWSSLSTNGRGRSSGDRSMSFRTPGMVNP